jgi:hypothetical protein
VSLPLRDVFTAPRPQAHGNLAAMRFGIGGTFARCSACQGEDFYPAFPLTADRREVLVCARCENQAIYAELIGRPGASTRIPARPARRSRKP